MTELMTTGLDLHSDPSADPIMDIIAGGTRYKIMMQCLEIGLFDEIESLGEACTAESIAKKCGYDVAVLERLLSTLASYNLLQKDCNRKGSPSYRNSSGTSKYLTRSRRPTMIGLAMSVDTMIIPVLDNLPMLLKSGKGKLDINKNVADSGNIMMSSPNHQKAPNNIMDKENNMGPGSPIKQNTPTMPHIPKMPCMPKMPPNSKMPMEKNGMDYQAKFLMAMEGFSATCASAMVKAFDLRQHRSAVDLGGATGRISYELANTYPHMKVTVFDLPPVIQIAQKMQNPCSQGQVFFKAGNFFEDDIPSADLYLLGHIIHGFDLKGIDKLLQKVYSKLPRVSGSVLVMEKILAENRTEPELAVTNDFLMTLLSQGQERTLSDYQKLFAKHGFVNVQFTHIDGLNYYDVMLLKKPF